MGSKSNSINIKNKNFSCEENVEECYEILSENCKILWREDFEISNQKYTQVSGYIFNSQRQLLIVKNGNIWTIPGGHPENNETFLQTLNREIMEEACVKISDARYIGSVEVVEKEEKYYQLRFVATISELLPFKQEWEISERLFVELKDLDKYITWCHGETFQKQLNSALKIIDKKTSFFAGLSPDKKG